MTANNATWLNESSWMILLERHWHLVIRKFCCYSLLSLQFYTGPLLQSGWSMCVTARYAACCKNYFDVIIYIIIISVSKWLIVQLFLVGLCLCLCRTGEKPFTSLCPFSHNSSMSNTCIIMKTVDSPYIIYILTWGHYCLNWKMVISNHDGTPDTMSEKI